MALFVRRTDLQDTIELPFGPLSVRSRAAGYLQLEILKFIRDFCIDPGKPVVQTDCQFWPRVSLACLSIHEVSSGGLASPFRLRRWCKPGRDPSIDNTPWNHASKQTAQVAPGNVEVKAFDDRSDLLSQLPEAL
jgi:hypothetical protein